MNCKICQSTVEPFGTLKILGSFDAHYLRCRSCGFVYVEHASWLEQAYSSAIVAADTGIVSRNLKLAEVTSLLIGLGLPRAQRFLDFGGGSGLLVRMMRDRGFDFRLQDKYCANLLARGFDMRPGDRFDLITLMEVAEHLVDPVPTFEELRTWLEGEISALVVSTELLPASGAKPGEWWYYSPETGQHISFYTEAALRVIAERLGLKLATNGSNFHVLSAAPVSRGLLRAISSRKGRALARAAVRLAGRRRRPLTDSDAQRVREATLPEGSSLA